MTAQRQLKPRRLDQQPINPRRSSQPQLTQAALKGYQSLMSAEAWSRLHPAIQRRFSEQLNESVTYLGIMNEVYLSFAGKIFAQICRLMGNPLALYCEKQVPIEVNVYPNTKLNGMTWDRHYCYRKHSFNRVISTKCKRHNSKLVEMVGFGFGMELIVKEREHAIVFESQRFFWRWNKLRLTIPHWLSPGKTIVTQKAIDDEQFEFKLTVTHSILGEVFRQKGYFQSAD